MNRSMNLSRLTVFILAGLCFAASLAYAGPPDLTLGPPITGFSSPVYVTHAPGDFDRIFVVEQRGTVRIVQNGTLIGGFFLDIQSQVACCGEQGLLGLAFHPNYPSPPLIYVYYIEEGTGDTVVSRFTVPQGTPNNADETTEVELLHFARIQDNHNGGWIGFSPIDGYLYISSGDGGGGCDPENTGQDLNRLLGKILRIDVNSGSPYAIPPTNPFVGVAGLDEIWAFGLRNPWRCAFDSVTGDFFIADVGQGEIEEVNFQPANSPGGVNYGWDCKEGTQCATISGCSVGACNCNNPTFVDPVTEYDHNAGCSITGGEVYRGCAIPDLAGTYFYADWCSGTVWSFRMVSGVVTDFQVQPFSAGTFGPTGFGRDAYGEIYICSNNSGTVRKIIPTIPGPFTDCNQNTAEDACEIRDGSAADFNENGVIDTCEPVDVPAASPWAAAMLLTLLLVGGSFAVFRNADSRCAAR